MYQLYHRSDNDSGFRLRTDAERWHRVNAAIGVCRTAQEIEGGCWQVRDEAGKVWFQRGGTLDDVYRPPSFWDRIQVAWKERK